jgi:hypothetical protein
VTPADVVVVDAANVVGSRPTGWWRDRAGAAARLVEGVRRIAAADATGPTWVVVLEGDARAGAAAADGPVAVVHADGSGDDAIVAATEAAHATSSSGRVLVVTADRGLRARVEAVGATTTGPRWLWDRLDADR